jgi:diacylglycerol kinase family enzyme
MAVEDPSLAALRATQRAKRMLLVVNPKATGMKDRLRHLVVYALQGRFDVTVRETQRPGHAMELAREAAAEAYDVVVAFGGDGTVNEAVNGLVGSQTALTTIPGGNNNVFAKELGIPNDIVDATEHLLKLADRWEPRDIDLGTLNGRYFTFAAGMGLDASVVERVDSNPALKARFGHFYFVEAAVATFLTRYLVKPPKLSVAVDGGEPVIGVSAFFQNTTHYTYFEKRPVQLVEGGGFDSGKLAGVVLTRARPYDVPTITFRALSGAARIAAHPGITAFAGFDTAVVLSVDGRPIPIHVDGDYIGAELEARFQTAPAALRVVA